MASQSRDKLIMMLLPAVAIVLLYCWLYSEQGKLLEARKGLEKAKASAVSPQTLDGARARIAALDQEQAKVRSEKSALEKRWQAISSTRNRTAAERAAAFQRLSKLIWRGGLFTVEESSLEGSSAQIPASLDDMFRRLVATPTGIPKAPGVPAEVAPAPAVDSTPRLWKVRFLGRYRDVAAVLESLSEDGSPIIPVSITMSEAPLETDWRNWTLLVWM